MDELLGPAVAAAPAPHHQIIEATPVDRQRPEERRKKSKKIVDDIKLVFDFHIPFTSRRKEKKAKKAKKPYEVPRPEGGMRQPKGPEHFTIPPGLRYPPPQMGFPGPTMHPAPPPPPPPMQGPPMHGPPMHGPPMGQRGGQITPPISVYSYGSTDSSPSPVIPTREHQRPRARSLSLTRQYEERKRVIREQERREHAERVARAENAARLRAERDAEQIREERDRERRRNEAVERERRQRRQEERERQAQAIAARQRREDADRRRAAEAVVEREQRQLARRRRDEEEQWRIEEERRRLERQRRAIIPRAPRHAVEIHHHHHHHEPAGFEHEARGNFEQRGDQVINDAIRARQARQAEQGWPAEGGPRRRRTIGAGERRVFDDDRRRWGDLGRRWL
ncbi:MAG: hypothetical protein Q9193_002482 [Seirophora villosa]